MQELSGSWERRVGHEVGGAMVSDTLSARHRNRPRHCLGNGWRLVGHRGTGGFLQLWLGTGSPAWFLASLGLGRA